MGPSFLRNCLSMGLVITRHIRLQNNQVHLNGILELALKKQSCGSFLRSVYRHYAIGYPKFFKMDNLSKLGFLSAEILLKGAAGLRDFPQEAIGIILGNASSSWDSDEAHQESIRDRSRYFPSPSVFVYTLASIMAGEIAIRHKIKGENTLFVFDQFDPGFMVHYVSELFHSRRVACCLSGWIECQGDGYESFLFVVERADRTKRLKKRQEWFTFDPLNLGSRFDKGTSLCCRI
jgi:hypothetical protein